MSCWESGAPYWFCLGGSLLLHPLSPHTSRSPSTVQTPSQLTQGDYNYVQAVKP